MNRIYFLTILIFVLPISFSLQLYKNETIDPYITCGPKVIFYLRNSTSDVNIYSANLNLTPNLNYVSFYPRKLFAGEIGKFEFDLEKINCDYLNKEITANLTVNSSDGIQNFIYSFKVGNPLRIELYKSDESVEVGKDVFDPIFINNSCGSRNINANIKIPSNVYLIYYTPDGAYDNLKNISIEKGYPIKIEIIGAQPGKGTIYLNFTDVSCSNVTSERSINVQTYTISKGITSFKSLNSPAILYLFILSSFVFGKIIKRRLS